MRYVATLITIAAVFWTSAAQADDSDKVDSAVQFLRMACVTGDKLEIEGSTDGDLLSLKRVYPGNSDSRRRRSPGLSIH